MISLSRDGLVILFVFLCAELTKGVSNFQNLLAIWRHYSGQLQDGNSSYYGYYPGGGACSLDPLSTDYSHRGWIKVAAGDGEFQKSLGCGMCVEIKGQGILADLSTRGKIPKTPIIGPIYAIVIDRCGNCRQGFDLYAPGSDVWKTHFRAIDCPRAPGVNGNIKFRFVESNPWAMKLQTRNSRVVTVGLEVLQNRKWVCLPRSEDNYFLMGSPKRIKFPLRVRLTSVSGEQLESDITEFKNDVDITSSVQFSGFIKGSDPRTIKCYGQGSSVNDEYNETTDESFCKGKYDGSYNDPKDCTAYYQCLGGSTIRSRCPGHQVFNAILKTCDNPTNFPCKQRSIVSTSGQNIERVTSKIVKPQTEKDEARSKPDAQVAHAYCNDKFDGFYEDPNDCQAFFQCLKGTATKRYCLKGMVFNAMLKTCDTPNNFPCRLAEDTAAASLQTDKAAANPDHRQEGKHDRKPSLANSTISDPITRAGKKPETTDAVKPPVIESESKTKENIVDKDFCLDRNNGNYADPYDCSGYYTCLGGQTKKEDCPKTLRYNYDTGECDWPANVKCINQPLFKAWIHRVRTGKDSGDEGLTIHGSITRVTAVAREHIIHKPGDEIIIINENDNRKK